MNKQTVARSSLLVGSLLLSFILSFLDLYPQKRSGANSSPLFGITYHTELRFNSQNKSFNREETIKDLEAIKGLSVDIVRTDVSWQRVPIDSQSALEFDEWLIEQTHSLGMKILFVIKTPEQIKLYSPILAKADYWQIGNEPNSLAFAQAVGNQNYDETIQYLISNLNLVKSYSPTILTALNPVDAPRIRGVISASWLEMYSDLERRGISSSIVGLDSYPGGPYEWGYPSETGRLIRTTERELNTKSPIWLMETGSPTYRRSLDSQSRFIQEVVLSAVAAGADGMIVYEAFDNSNVSSELTDYVEESKAIEANFGLFYENRIPKPAAQEYKLLIGKIKKNAIPDIPAAGFAYAILSGILRLVMPTGGPTVLSELSTTPSLVYSGIGLLFRYVLAETLSNRVKQKIHKNILTDLFWGLIFLSAIVVFQLSTGTFILIWYLWLGYSILFLLYLWCGTAQIRAISEYAGGKRDRRRIIASILPPSLGFFIALYLELPAFGWFLYIILETTIILIMAVIANSIRKSDLAKQ